MKLYLLAILLIISIIALIVTKYNIPKVAWSFWDKDVPPIVQRIMKERDRTMPDWKHILLTNDTLGNYIDLSTSPKGYEKLQPQHKADWIRLKLLEKHGGLWLDSSIIVNNGAAINEIYNDAISTRAEIGCFTLNKPVPEEYIENWFIMAPRQSRIIREWLKEFENAIRTGFINYRAAIMASDIPISDSIYNDGPKNVYLTQHACLQVVLKRRIKTPCKILLYPADRNMFKVQTECDWKYNCIIDKISNDPEVNKLPFIKLRGGEKTIDYEKYFARSRFLKA